jgi:uncharacterized YceG family protein
VSEDSGRGSGDDPFVDPDDAESIERAERRREREAKRAQKAKKRKKDAPSPPPPPKEAAPTVPRTPEQEFWDEPAEPAPPVPGQEPGGLPKADPEKAELGRKRLFGRRRDKSAAAAGAAAAAAEGSGGGGASAPPSGAAPATGETPTAKAPPPPAKESARPKPAAPATGDQPVPDAGPPTAAQPIPPLSEAQQGPTADLPQPDPGRGTAAAPRLDPNQPPASNAVAGEAGSGGRRQALPPRPSEETGAGDWEPPPPRDDDWFDDDDFDEEGDPNMAGAARSGRRHGEDGGRRGGLLGALLRHPFRILGVVILIIVLLFLNSLFQPFHGDGNGHVVVKIPKGSSVGEVGDLLEKKGVISGGFIVPGSTLFQARVTLDGKRSSLFAGKFSMAKDMSYGDAIDQLSKEPAAKEQAAKPGIIEVTIPEGQSRPITAKLVKEDGIKGNYLKATKKSKLLNPAEYGGKGAKDLEGFLFPDTWQFNTKKPVENLVALQLQDFKKEIKKVNMKYAKSKNLTVYDVVTIASIIEREAGVAKQRKLVASVIYNRLHEGMTLGMDSTIRFATGNYEKPLTQSELESNSPYNTRTTPGLPPGPINSPGLEAMQAAAHPAKTGYLFFVNNPNSCDELAFAKTEEEFLEDEAKYSKAREKNGGNQPSTCK